ncbi:hypothetical protein SD235_00025 [Burkholderia cepacia]|uniref:hypothetical protein n=1 Tax=Burkholderia cepacia TaxID=292 RepID=UPI003A4DB48F
MRDFVFTSRFLNNILIVVDGLAPDEPQTAKWLHDDLRDLAYSVTLPTIERSKVRSVEDLIELLKHVRKRCLTDGLKPILHFEAHGSEEVIAVANGEMKWADLIPHLREIYLASNGNLGIVMSTCHGFHALKPIKIKKSTPFTFLMGSQEEITVGQIKSNMILFYKELFLSGNLEAAMAMVESTFRQYNSEQFFARTIGTVIRRNSIGHMRVGRIRQALAFVSYTALPRDKRRTIYWAVKKHTRPSKKMFDRYANVFLPCGHSIDMRRLVAFIWENYRKKFSYARERLVPPPRS